MKNQVEQLRMDVLTQMEEYAVKLRLLEMNVEADTIEQKIEEFRQGIYQVLFTGSFNAGKSTTLNAIMRQKLLFVSINPATPVITRIVNGEDKNMAIVTYRDSKRPDEEMTVEEFRNKFQLNTKEPEKYREVKYVTIQRRLPSETVVFVDSPGLGNTDNDDFIANEYTAQADAVVFMLHATMLMSSNDKEYIRRYYERRHLKNVFFVANWYNVVPPYEEESIQERIEYALHEVFVDENGNFDRKLYESRVFFVDSLTSECARTGCPKEIRKGKTKVEVKVEPEEDAYSGIPEFEEALYEFLQSSDKDKEGYRGYLPRMAGMYRVASNSIEKRIKEAKKNIKELEKEKEIQEKAINELNQILDNIGRSFDNAMREIMIHIGAAYDGFVRNVDNHWEDYFEQEDNRVKFGLLDEAKIFALKAKHFGQNVLDNIRGIERDDSVKIARDQEFQKLISPISGAIEAFLNVQSKTMENQIMADSQETIDRLAKDLEVYSQDLQDLQDSGINIADILASMSHSGKVDPKSITGKANMAQVLISALLFNNVDAAFENIAGGGMSWGAFLKDLIQRELVEIVLITIIASLNGIVLVYLIARAVYAVFRGSKAAKGISKKILIQAKGETLQALKNTRDKSISNMEQRFNDTLGGNHVAFTCSFKAQLQQKLKQLEDLIRKIKEEGYNAEAEEKRMNEILSQMVGIFNQMAKLLGSKSYTKQEILDCAVFQAEKK